MRLYDTPKIFIIKVIYKFKSTKNSSCGIKFIKNVCFIFIIMKYIKYIKSRTVNLEARLMILWIFFLYAFNTKTNNASDTCTHINIHKMKQRQETTNKECCHSYIISHV